MNDAAIPVITVDGPSGSGKGTVAQRLAQEMGWHFLDSGALYRVLARAAQNRKIPLNQEDALSELALKLDVAFEAAPHGDSKVILDGVEVGPELRTEAAGDAASQVAALPAVRTALLARQRAFRQAPGLVADGRDMGTVVFPDAGVKIFLTASAAERAQRRHKQLKEKGLDANLGALIADIEARDKRDSERAVSPLVPARDAVLLDTTELSLEDSVAAARDIVQRHGVQ